jgi:hypothetical protein
MQAILFAATKDAVTSRQFYESTLGSPCKEGTPFELVCDIGSTELRVQNVEIVVNTPHTTLCFTVADISQTVAQLEKKGVEFVFHEFMKQDQAGIWTAPNGTAIA